MNDTVNFTPVEESILYTALLHFEMNAQNTANEAAAKGIPIRQPMQWISDETGRLRKKLFPGADANKLDPFNEYINNRRG